MIGGVRAPNWKKAPPPAGRFAHGVTNYLGSNTIAFHNPNGLESDPIAFDLTFGIANVVGAHENTNAITYHLGTIWHPYCIPNRYSDYFTANLASISCPDKLAQLLRTKSDKRHGMSGGPAGR